MAMCSSDANAISAVFTRDIAPAVSVRARGWSHRTGLLAARLSTVSFLALSMAIATQVTPGVQGHHHRRHQMGARARRPISIPFLLGMLPVFRSRARRRRSRPGGGTVRLLADELRRE